MERPYSFQDELARLRAERQEIDDRAESRAAYQRFLDYRHGEEAADDIIGRVMTFGSTYERNTQTLREAAAAQPPGLAGSVAARLLTEAADINERNTPDTQAEARRLAALERLRQEAAARVEREALAIERGNGRERD